MAAAVDSQHDSPRTVIVWYHSFDLRVHDHAPLAAAAGWTEAVLAAHPELAGQGRKEADVHGPAGRGNGTPADRALPHPALHAHVLPVYIFDVDRCFHRSSLSSILDGPSKTKARQRDEGFTPTRPIGDDASDITDESIPHPNETPPAKEQKDAEAAAEATASAADKKEAASTTATAAAASNQGYKPSAYLSSQATLDRTTVMKTDLKRAAFLLECVADLQSNLRALGSDLLIRVGKTEEVLEQLMRDSNAASLYAHIDYAEEEIVVSRQVAAACARQNVSMRLFEGNTLYWPADLPWPLDKVPDVFTPFRTRVEQMGPAAVRSTLPYSLAVRAEDLVDAASVSAEQRELLCSQPVPQGFKMKPMPAAFAAERSNSNSLPTYEALGYSARAIRRFTESNPEAKAHAAQSNFPFRGGETAALQHVRMYVWGALGDEQTAAATVAAAKAATSAASSSSDPTAAASTAPPAESSASPLPACLTGGPITHYKDTRNSLNGRDYSSKFSPFLSAGCLSARRIHEQVQAFERTVLRNASTTWLQVELLFRDHFRFLADKYGPKVFWKYGPNPRNWSRSHKAELEWRTDVRLMRAWCLGQTGYPFIDSCMRELLFTGYMSNRGRQVVASFLLHDLKLDWRLGAAWFESQLIDHDIASNYGNWTYQAGVAFDPRSPYRYFNIRKQESMYDPTHSHQRLWLPELFSAEATTTAAVDLKEDHAASAAKSESSAISAASLPSSEEHKESESAPPVHSHAAPPVLHSSTYPKPIVPLQSDHAGGAAQSTIGSGGDGSAKGPAKTGAEGAAAGAAPPQHHPHRRGGGDGAPRQSGGGRDNSGSNRDGGGGRNGGGRSGGGGGGGRGGDERGGQGGRAPQGPHGGRGAPRSVAPPGVTGPTLTSMGVAPPVFSGGIRFVGYAPVPTPYILGPHGTNPAALMGAMGFGGMQPFVGVPGAGAMGGVLGFHPNQPLPYNSNHNGGGGAFPRPRGGGGGGRPGSAYQQPHAQHGPRPPRGQLVSNNPYSTG